MLRCNGTLKLAVEILDDFPPSLDRWAAIGHQPPEQAARLQVGHIRVSLLVVLQPLQDLRQPHHASVEHGASAVPRPTIAKHIDHIYVFRPCRYSILQDAEALIDQGIEAALKHLLVVYAACHQAVPGPVLLQKAVNPRIRPRYPTARFVVLVPSPACFLTKPPPLTEHVSQGAVPAALSDSSWLL